MSVTLPISKTMLPLADVGERLSLQVNPDRDFFPEWRQDLPSLTTDEQQTIDRLQARFAALYDGIP
jgi:hypothetical protein